jgi:predicted amidohydrolase
VVAVFGESKQTLNSVKVFALQLDIAWENKGANYAKVTDLLASAKPPGDSLVVLPEMFATGFTMNTENMAEPYGGETEKSLSQTAKAHGIWLVGGVAARGANGALNKALVFSPSGELAAYYAKQRLFTPGGESEHYVPGVRPKVFQWQQCMTSVFVCYDLRFPELFRQTAAANRPELFLVIASWPEKRILHWVRLLQARAIENQAYVVGVNRVGKDPYYTYVGRSLIIDPNGDILADAGEREGWISADLDLEKLKQYRQGLPFLDDMQPGLQGKGTRKAMQQRSSA